MRSQLIARLVGSLEESPLVDRRDRALLLIGFAGALRRSELVALDVEDITEDDHGLHLRRRRSKTDQEGESRIVGVPYGSHPATCLVRAWRAWRAYLAPWDNELMERTGPPQGSAFRAVGRWGLRQVRTAERSGSRRHHQAASLGRWP